MSMGSFLIFFRMSDVLLSKEKIKAKYSPCFAKCRAFLLANSRMLKSVVSKKEL